MKFFTKFFVVLVVSGVATEALHCYQCQHMRPDPVGSRSPTTCEAGKSPKSAHLKECKDEEFTYISLGSGRHLGVSKPSGLRITDHVAPLIIPQQEDDKTTYSCYKLTMNGQEIVNKTGLSITHRGCLQIFDVGVNGTFPDKCYEGKNSEMDEKITELELKGLLSTNFWRPAIHTGDEPLEFAAATKMIAMEMSLCLYCIPIFANFSFSNVFENLVI
ncbi:hypothetical protein Ocin01_16750 [Orchesella cincta]|uniref:Protein quiver n=1 Tax=Orchesella cincta TaxID=48709 RepID=A0A1D2MAN8_ORCCI|nr:hypothetical protein Ocin01_16750 [Orchesella cincta]